MAKPVLKQEETSLKDRLSRFFRISKQNTAANVTVKPDTKEIIFTHDLLQEICKESPLAVRVATIRALNETVATKRLEKNATEHLWLTVCDLLDESSPEARQSLLKFLECLIKGQYEQLEMTRAVFFDVLERHVVFEDLSYRLNVFKTLTDDGKDLTYFEEKTGELLLRWIPDIMASARMADFLALLINIIKHNAAYMDQHIVAQFVQSIYLITHRIRSYEDMEMCLGVLDAIVCYSYLPSEALYVFVLTLCRMLNIERFSLSSLKLMRNLLGTHLGHSGIRTMCAILQDRQFDQDPKLLRGAVYYIGMALWGSRMVTTLGHPPSAVLPSFLQALQNTGSNVVAHEVVLSIHRLMKKYGKDQHMVSCQIILDIVDALRMQFETYPPDPSIYSQFHEMLTTIQELCQAGHFQGDKETLYNIIEKCANSRPEASVVGLLTYKEKFLHPSHYNWIQKLIALMDFYFKNDSRTLIRKEALAILARVVRQNKHQHREELIENVVLVVLKNLDADTDPDVRFEGVQLVVELAKQCQSQQCADLLTILEKVIKHPIVGSTVTSPIPDPEPEDFTVLTLDECYYADIEIAAYGLISIFESKLYQLPSSDAIQTYTMLLGIVTLHYQERHLAPSACNMRAAIFGSLLALRADALSRLGFPRKCGRYFFSPYIFCDSSNSNDRTEKQRISVTSPPQFVAPAQSSVPHFRTSPLYYLDAFNLIIVCLEMELDWPVLKLVLENLPNLLQNKTLVLSAQSCVEKLCHSLYNLVSNRKLEIYEKLSRKPSNFNRSQFHCYILPILASLSSYHLYLDKRRQKELIYCLDFGLVSKCSKTCVSALTVCMLEMKDVMINQLPAILQRLSQITPTSAMASPMLEFLSSLIRLPKLYANFVAKQYISIFAISLPYTNPFKFVHYTVSLAHHVIAMWFLKCRLPFRKDFVSYINRGLKGNVLRQFEEKSRAHVQRMNQDSSDTRRRLRSFGEYSSLPKRPTRSMVSVAGPTAESHARLVSQQSIGPHGSPPLPSGPLDEDGAIFHKELTETCVDMMARYTFSSCSSMPKRTPVSEFLLKGGQVQSWLVGNKIVTITTSGGEGRVDKGGLCDKCFKLCGGQTEAEKAEQAKASKSMASKRRRHKSAAVTSLTSAPSPKPTSQDDIVVYRTTSESRDDDASTAGSSNSDINVTTSASESSVDSADIRTTDLLLGLKRRDSIFNPQLCPCWCNGWVEVFIRRPTGNVSWIMRIQNDQLVPYDSNDFPLYDISALFRGGTLETAVDETDTISGRIDSESLGENEYESLFEIHFPSPADRIAAECEEKKSTNSKEDADKSLNGIPVSKLKVESPGLRKTQSSPDISSDLAAFLEKNVEAQKAHAEAQNAEDSVSTEPETEVNAVTSEVKICQTTSAPAVDIPHSTDKLNTETCIASSRTPDRTTSDPGPQARANSPFVDLETKMEVSVNRLSRKSLEEKDEEEAKIKESADEVKDLPAVSSLRKTRGHTISVMTSSSGSDVTSSSTKENFRTGITPSFVFLQLYHSPIISTGEERPVLLPAGEVMDRALKVLDHIPPYETHKIGVVYVGDGQTEDEAAILSNVYGSSRYAEFLHGLGHLIRLHECSPEHQYVGGLDTSGQDGLFAYSWRDDVMQVIFHVATLMPCKETDPNSNAKKLHIGNDYVTIVYNNSNKNYKIGTIRGQFNYVNIVISPLDHRSNSVTIQCKSEIEDVIGQTEIKVVSDASLPVLVRQVAVHANLASLILQRQKTQPKDPYASNWLERLRQIKRIYHKVETEKKKLQQQHGSENRSTPSRQQFIAEDFTDYVYTNA